MRKRFLRSLFLVIKDAWRHCFKNTICCLIYTFGVDLRFFCCFSTYPLSPMPLPFPLPPYRLPLSTPATEARLPGLSCWFLHYGVKNQTKRIIEPTDFLLWEVLEQPKTNIYTHFHFERVFLCVIEYAEFLSFCVPWHLHGGRESCHVG